MLAIIAGLNGNRTVASITIRNLSEETKERLRKRAKQRGCSFEALARSILDEAANKTEQNTNFPYNLMSLVEPGEDIEPYLQAHDQLIPQPDLR